MVGFIRGKRRFLCLAFMLALVIYAINPFHEVGIWGRIAQFRQYYDTTGTIHSNPIVSPP
jgi:hypothetical protein